MFFRRCCAQKRDILRTAASMKTLLSIVAIATLTATTDANFLELTKEALKNLRLTDPKAESSGARLINPQSRIELKLKRQSQNEIEFHESSLLYGPFDVTGDDICKHFLGVYVKEIKQTFCKLKTLTLKLLQNESGKQYIDLILFMDSKGTDPFALHVPILMEPCPVDSTQIDDLITLIKEELVELWGPINVEQLERARATGTLVINFSWLIVLLSRGVTRSSTQFVTPETQHLIRNYVTLPIMVPKGELKLYADLINLLND